MKTAQKAVALYSTGCDAYTLAPFSNQADIFTVGAGYLNIQAALSNNDLATTTHQPCTLSEAEKKGRTHTAPFELEEYTNASDSAHDRHPV